MTDASHPLVTIALPVYNSERYLAQSIESLLGQTYRNFVMVITDNASTDGTADICMRYARQDSRIQYHRNSVNIGLPGNFNRCFELTKTKYIKWSTSDDYWGPDMLADAVPIMEADDSIVVCYPHTILIDSEGREQKKYCDELHLMQDDPAERFMTVIAKIGLVNHQLGLLRTAAVAQTHLWRPHVGADYGLVAELSLLGKFYNVPKYQMFRRFHPDSTSWQRTDQTLQARRYHAANSRKSPLVAWPQHWAYINPVVTGSLPLSKKLKLCRFLLRRLNWDRATLAREAVYFLRGRFSRGG